MKKNLLIATLLLLSVSLAAQRPNSGRIIPDELITLNRGIYFSLEEFLQNTPSIPYNFELIKDRSNYYDHSEEYSDYILVYTDIMGYKVALNLNDVWGFNDGNSVFLSYSGKPFELMHLGAISILSYHLNYRKNFLAQAFGLNTVGSGITSMEKSIDVLLHLKNDTIIVPTAKSFRQLLADDAELYHDYKTDRNTDSMEKPIVYINKYNEKHPLLITEKGIELIDTRESSEL